MNTVKHMIAIASGKGGVGKSTTTANLALALQAQGARVGVLDADIYGPSIPMMLGAKSLPETKDDRYMIPVDCHGIQTMSIGYLIEQDDTPMIWRGPMVTRALQQLLTDTLWDNLDYLLIDLPPGTGDIQLSLTQKAALSGAIIVTTPQDVALLDARKALKMFEKVNVPVLGIVENMSTHICEQCGHEQAIFGADGGQRIAEQYGVSLLGRLPLDIKIREKTDNGEPIIIMEPESPITQAYLEIARQVMDQAGLQSNQSKVKFPKIVVEYDK